MTHKPIPPFPDEAAEDAFWQQTDSTDAVDWSRAVQAVFPNIKPSTQSISLRLPKPLLHRLKMMANQRDVPYQSLIKTLLFDAVQREDRP